MTVGVWAPAAARVEVVVSGRTQPLQRDEGGWWRLDGDLPAGTDYAFRLDGSEALPDPRSPWQPVGVHGPSRTVDHRAYRWQTDRWRSRDLRESVIYELHIGTFSLAGTFRGVIERLDALVELGVTHVEVMPVNEFAGTRGWGYDGVDLYAPHHSYGDPDDFRALIDACHARDLGVILDVVYNHVGPTGNYLDRYGPYFSERFQTPWGRPMNLDGPGSNQVRRFFIDNALMWLRDYRCDGLRVDAVHALVDTSATHFLEELSDAVHRLAEELGRALVVIGESDLNDPRVVRLREQGGYGMDAQWSDDFHHAVHALLTREQAGIYGDFGSLEDVAKAYREAFVYDGRYSLYRDRRHGRAVGDLSGERFVVCLQNHDQVGNRPHGERIGHLVGPERQRIGAALVLFSPFVPLIFQGEEWAASTPFPYFVDPEDAQMAEAIRRGRREEFRAWWGDVADMPDPSNPATFEQAKLRWAEADQAPHREMRDWYRRLIGLRATEPSLWAGVRGMRIESEVRGDWLRIDRGEFSLTINLADEPRTVADGRPGQVVLASGSAVWIDGGLRLDPVSVAISRHGEAG
jgi:maltooligosyltrehalose trehalohydrolase